MKLLTIILKYYFVTVSILGAVLLVWSFIISNYEVLGYLSISVLVTCCLSLFLAYLQPCFDLLNRRDAKAVNG